MDQNNVKRPFLPKGPKKSLSQRPKPSAGTRSGGRLVIKAGKLKPLANGLYLITCLQTNLQRVCFGLLAYKPLTKGLWTTCKPLVYHLKKVFLTMEANVSWFFLSLASIRKPLAKGRFFLPLAKSLAWIANHLQRLFKVTCKQNNLQVFIFSQLVKNQLEKGLHRLTI